MEVGQHFTNTSDLWNPRGCRRLFTVFICPSFSISLSENTSPAVILKGCTVTLNLIQKKQFLNFVRRNPWQCFREQSSLMPHSSLGLAVPWALKLMLSVWHLMKVWNKREFASLMEGFIFLHQPTSWSSFEMVQGHRDIEPFQGFWCNLTVKYV